MTPAAKNLVQFLGASFVLLGAPLLVVAPAGAAGGTYGSIRHAKEGMFVDPGSQRYEKQALSPSDRSLQHDQQRVSPTSRPADPSRVNVSPLSRPADPDSVNVQPWHPQDNWFAREASGSPSRDSDKAELWEPKSETQRYYQDAFMGGKQRRAAQEAQKQQRVREPQEGRDYAASRPEDRATGWDRVEQTFSGSGADWYEARNADLPDPGERVADAPAGYETVKAAGDSYAYYGGTFYRKQAGGYAVVPAPVGAVVPAPPMGYTTVHVGREIYFYYHGAFYAMNPGGEDYRVVRPPQGAVVDYLPEGARKQTSPEGTVRYVYEGVHYRPLYADGQLAYEVIG